MCYYSISFLALGALSILFHKLNIIMTFLYIYQGSVLFSSQNIIEQIVKILLWARKLYLQCRISSNTKSKIDIRCHQNIGNTPTYGLWIESRPYRVSRDLFSRASLWLLRTLHTCKFLINCVATSPRLLLTTGFGNHWDVWNGRQKVSSIEMKLVIRENICVH